MPVPATVEGQRVSMTNVEVASVAWTANHTSTPTVSITLEPADVTSYTTATVMLIGPAGFTVQFSSPFSGYLHLHAFSVA